MLFNRLWLRGLPDHQRGVRQARRALRTIQTKQGTPVEARFFALSAQGRAARIRGDRAQCHRTCRKIHGTESAVLLRWQPRRLDGEHGMERNSDQALQYA
jgi:hypothetical protein